FEFPPGEVDVPQVWSPLQLDPTKLGGRGSHNYNLLGELKPGVSQPQAQAEVEAYVRAQGEAHPPGMHEHFFNPKFHTVVSYSLQGEVVGGVRPALLMLLVAVGFV